MITYEYSLVWDILKVFGMLILMQSHHGVCPGNWTTTEHKKSRLGKNCNLSIVMCVMIAYEYPVFSNNLKFYLEC